MHATYKIKPLNTPFSELVEISTGVRVYLGNCAGFAERMGLTLL